MIKFLIALFVISPSLTFAQAIFSKGIIVTSSSDTISGYIEEKYWMENPNHIYFKKNLTDKSSKRLNIEDISFFRILDGSIYQRFSVNVSLDEINGEPNRTSNSRTENRTVLLKVLAQGNTVSLYEYRDSLKSRYYIKELIGIPEELEYHVTLEEGNLRKKNKFVGQLLYLADNNGKLNSQLRKKIENLPYKEDRIIAIINELNQIKNQQTTARNAVTLFFGGGVNQSWLDIKGKNPFLTGERSNNTTLFPSILIGFEIADKKKINKTRIRTELSAWKKEAGVTTTDISEHQTSTTNYSYSEMGISLQPKILFDLFNPISFGFGPTISYSNVSSERFLTDRYIADYHYFDSYVPPKLEKLYFSLQVQTNLRLTKQLEITGSFTSTLNRTNYKPYRIKDEIGTLGLNYRLNRKTN